jgi:hypothetical protein
VQQRLSASDAAWEQLVGARGVWDTEQEAAAQVQRYWRHLCRCDSAHGAPETPVSKSRAFPSTPVVPVGPRLKRACLLPVAPHSNRKPQGNRGGAHNTGMKLQMKAHNRAAQARLRFKFVANPLKARDLRAANRRQVVRQDWVNHSLEQKNARRRARAATERWLEYSESGDPTWYKEHSELLVQHVRSHTTHELQ